MPKLHRWWLDRPSERFWLEVTDRTDLGTNLKAPQADESGGEFWSYSLVREVNAGDTVFHYDRASHSVIGVSRGTGDTWKDEIVWGARGSFAREAGVVPYPRPGWYAGLTAFQLLGDPLPLDAIREEDEPIRGALEALELEVGSPLYFPFERGRKRPPRPVQGYLFKLPEFFVTLFPQLRSFMGITDLDTTPARGSSGVIGGDYRRADEQLSVGVFDPMEVDPAIVERGTRGHAVTQNKLADYLAGKGISPRSPKPDEPSFDLAWEVDGDVFVAEVKSMTDRNEERQLRMGLGQVLQYRHRLRERFDGEVVAVLAVEREPSPDWLSLCESLGLRLVWPGQFRRLGVRHTASSPTDNGRP